MEKITLIILHEEEDKEYSLALGKAISNLHNEFDVTVDMIGTIKNKKFDLALICSLNQGREKSNTNIKIHEKGTIGEDVSNNVIFLVEYQVETTPAGQVPKELYKYSKVQDLASELRLAYAMVTGKKNILNTKLNGSWIGLYSGSGGNGKTAISIGVAQELARYHDKRVLYISLEELESTSFYLEGGNSNKNMSDFLYYLFSKEHVNLCTFIESFVFVNTYGVEAFYPSKGRNELCQITKDELAYFFKVIAECNRYDYMILDFPENLSAETLELLENCTKVILIERDEFVSKEKSNRLIHYLEGINCRNLSDGFIRVRNMVAPEDEKDAGEILKIEKDDSSFCVRGSVVEISMDNIFGLGIKEVVGQIIR